MKSAFACTASFAIALGLALSGCSEKSAETATPPTQQEKTRAMLDSMNKNSNDSVLSAPAGYVGSLVKAKQSAVKTIDVSALNSAIEQFNVGEGRFPNNLEELVSKRYLTQVPPAPIGMKIVYDAATGVAKVENE